MKINDKIQTGFILIITEIVVFLFRSIFTSIFSGKYRLFISGDLLIIVIGMILSFNGIIIQSEKTDKIEDKKEKLIQDDYSPITILKKRYAREEITKKEF